MRINWTVLCAVGIALALCINPAYSATQAAHHHRHHLQHSTTTTVTKTTIRHRIGKHRNRSITASFSPDGRPLLISASALVIDQQDGNAVYQKNSDTPRPIASITKLMTGLVVVQAQQDMHEMLSVTEDDVDHEKHTSSRLRVGARMSRGDLLHIALMSSENRAASALGRNYPGGIHAFVEAMNAKAKLLGMNDTHYVDSSGLSSHNVASARDLAKLAIVAHQEPLLREYSTDTKYEVDAGGRIMHYSNTNRLVSNPDWDIGLQKTGFINEAGRCLVMQVMIQGRAVIMVFLDSKGKQSRTADAGRMRRWLEALRPPALG